jgi:hypothetical protein
MNPCTVGEQAAQLKSRQAADGKDSYTRTWNSFSQPPSLIMRQMGHSGFAVSSSVLRFPSSSACFLDGDGDLAGCAVATFSSAGLDALFGREVMTRDD